MIQKIEVGTGEKNKSTSLWYHHNFGLCKKKADPNIVKLETHEYLKRILNGAQCMKIRFSLRKRRA